MTSQRDYRAVYAKHVLEEAMSLKYINGVESPLLGLPPAPPPREAASEDDDPWSPQPVCIIGAGVAGMAAAIYIRDACVQAKVEVPQIDIYEATERSGGRIYSYQFNDNYPAVHDYYDIGAMRIPDITTMTSTLGMIKWLIFQGQDINLEQYFISDEEGREPLMYYYRNKISREDEYTKLLFKEQIKPTIKRLEAAKTNEEWTKIFKKLCDEYDGVSTRAYLLANGFTYKQTETAETFNTSTGLFDQAWMETVCDYFDFAAAEKANWYRLEDSKKKYGMQALTNAMENYLKSMDAKVKIHYNSPVTGLVYKKNSEILVSVNNGTTKPYETVINTTTMGCFGRMDIGGLGLSDDVLTGIRALGYDRSTKVAIKFSSDWWTPLLSRMGKKSKFLGGVSGTDLPISNVVYPSWQDEGSTILMVSYAWAQDATRLTSLIPDYNGVTQTERDAIANLCLRGLAKLWASVPDAPTYDQLCGSYQSHHAYAWANNPYTADAFALFGPGQFRHLYPLMAQPQCRGDGKNKVGLYFAGEATSVHHAWISGALDSAYTTVGQWAGIQLPTVQDSESIAPQQSLERNVIQQAMYDLPFGDGEGKDVPEMDPSLLSWANWVPQFHRKQVVTFGERD